MARWPATIAADATCTETVCHTDLLATAAEITGFDLPADAGEDSVSLLPAMMGQAAGPIREATIHHSVNGRFAIRQGQWKLVLCPGSGGWSKPRAAEAREAGLPDAQLFDLAADIAETNNLWDVHADVVQRLGDLLRKYIDDGRSTPGETQANDTVVTILPGS